MVGGLMKDSALLILAAGAGVRMQSELPKPLVPVGGTPILGHLLNSARRAGVDDFSVVVGHGAQQVREFVGSGVRTPLQEKRNGTAHAVWIARQSVQDARRVFVFVGDSPLLSPSSIKRLYQKHKETGAVCSFLTACFGRELPYARVIRDEEGGVIACVEERDASDEQKSVREYLSSHFLFDADALWEYLPQITPHERTNERYLTDIVGLIIEAGHRVSAVPIENWEELVGLNTPQDVVWAEGHLSRAGG